MSERAQRTAEDNHRPVLVSACLLGRTCRYDARHNKDDALERELRAAGEHAVPFCPEEAGGLGTPRPPAWLDDTAAAVVDGDARIRTENGHDVTDQFLLGAREALATCRDAGITKAYLKERSPSCGVCETHVNGERVTGPGVTTELLRRHGIEVRGVEGRRE